MEHVETIGLIENTVLEVDKMDERDFRVEI